MDNFVTSVPAQAAARCVVETARDLGLLDGPMAVSKELAEAEKSLFVQMFQAVDRHLQQRGDTLTPDEVASLFTFVFAKAAEAVTDMFNHKEHVFDLTGMFDGRIPLYADDAVTAEFKTSEFPSRCAADYLDFTEKEAEALRGCPPWLLLFEALKWCFRIGCHCAVTVIEHHHRLR